MNKTIKTMAVAALACVTLCGTAMAAPHHGRGPKPAPVHHRAPAHHHHHGCWVPPPPPPPPPVVHVHHGGNGLAVLGGAIVGGIVGAALAH